MSFQRKQVKDMNEINVFSYFSEEVTKLKTCSSNFVLSVTLLRVIEMIIYFDRNLIIDQEGSLGRVFQVKQNNFVYFLVYDIILYNF